jgi:hypothetical protein
MQERAVTVHETLPIGSVAAVNVSEQGTSVKNGQKYFCCTLQVSLGALCSSSVVYGQSDVSIFLLLYTLLRAMGYQFFQDHIKAGLTPV